MSVAQVLPNFPSNRITRKLEILTSDGLILRGWQMAAKIDQVKGNVIIVHGFKDYSERYLDFANQLSKNGYQVFAYDQRGHGRSEGDKVYFPNFEMVTNDLDLAIKTFKNFDNGKPWIVLGHSIGGSITARYTVTHEDGIAGFILSAPALKKMPDLPGFIVGALKATNAIAPHMGVVDLPNEKFSRDLKVVETMKTDPLIADIKIPARSGVGALENMDFVQENKAKTKIPFLVLHGTGDQINNIEGSREFFEGTPNIPGKQIKIYPILAHDLLHEPEHQEVEKDILHWINLIADRNQSHQGF
nr:alpha/beta hydrolase [Bacteriovorax sp. HI3]